MKITIITVCYNCAQEIESTIQSVLSQSYSDLEYIIVDGFSKDGTLEIINSYKDKITKIVSEPDHGIYDAMNKGTRLATGNWLLFMNAGDVFVDKDVIKRIFENRDIATDVKLICGDTILKFPYGYYVYDDDEMHFCHQSTFFEREALLKHPYDLSYSIIADANSVTQIKSDGGKVLHIKSYISIFEAYTGLSSSNPRKELEELYRLGGKKKDWTFYKTCIRYRLRRFKRSFLSEKHLLEKARKQSELIYKKINLHDFNNSTGI